MRTDNYVQIDVMEVQESAVVCWLYTPEGTVRILMTVTDYEQLNRNNFFIRDGKDKDSAGVVNTTVPYYPFTPQNSNNG